MPPDRDSLPDRAERREFPGWICPACGAWDSGSVMPRRAQWCDGACSHPKTAMVRITFIQADCEWSEMVAHHQKRFDGLRAENERLRRFAESAAAAFHDLDYESGYHHARAALARPSDEQEAHRG